MLAVTAAVEIGKVTVLAPAGTVADGGTIAVPGRELEIVTTVPLPPAIPPSIIVPVDAVPPVSDFGLRTKFEMVAGFTFSTVDLVTPLKVAEIVAVLCATTTGEVMVRALRVAPE